MARIRTIKPEFFTSEQIAECSTSARLLFVGMWCFCDDGGVHPASAKRLKMEIFPADPITDDEVRGLIDELIGSELLVEFEVGNERFWHVSKWEKHQKIDRPTLKHPRPDSPDSTTIRRALDEESSRPRDGMESNGMEERELKQPALSCAKKPKSKANSESVPEIPAKLRDLFAAWNELPAGITSKVAKVDSKPITDGWAKVQRNPDAAAAFDDIPKLMAAIKAATFLHGKPWFRLGWMFAMGSDRATWNVCKVADGQYGNASHARPATSGPRIKPVSEIRTNAVGGILP